MASDAVGFWVEGKTAKYAQPKTVDETAQYEEGDQPTGHELRKAHLASGQSSEVEEGVGGRILQPKHGIHVGKIESVNPTAGNIKVGGKSFGWKHQDYHASGSSARSYQSLLNMQKHVGRNAAVSWVHHHAFGPTIFGKSHVTLGSKD